MDKIIKLFIIALLPIFIFIPNVVSAGKITDTFIPDTYYGSDDHGRGDVIGPSSTFDTSGATVNLSDNGILTVEIATNFAGKGDDGLYSQYTEGGKGIGYGDLLLSDNWSPTGSSPYLSDDAANGTHWQYGFALDDRYSSPSAGAHGSGTVYELSGGSISNHNPGVKLSDDFMTGAIFRNGQAVAVDKASASIIDADKAEWWVEDGKIVFQIDISGTGLASADEIAIHWTMTCGNDVFEGSARVSHTPIPAPIVLLGTGLVGLIGLKRKKTLSG
ncbi:MAG: hypothetical protein JRH15_16295 [Deltaproteobacteria bacterium]|nr:hypothetical protein [Deltaproteobacteria bacterium]